MSETEFEKKEVGWNINSQRAFALDQLLLKAQNAALAGNVPGEHEYLKKVRYYFLNHALKPEKKKKFNKIEKVVNKYSNLVNKYSLAFKHEDMYEHKKRFYFKKFKEYKIKHMTAAQLYQIKIMDSIKEQGYLPDKDNKVRINF